MAKTIINDGDVVYDTFFNALNNHDHSAPTEDGGGDITAVVQAIIQSLNSTVPSGAIQAFARNTAPTGWLSANGAAVSRTTYAALFAAIGTTFGVGDGSTTFNLPDLRGEFVRGWDDSRGVDSGRALGSAQADEYKSHAHTNGATVVRYVNTGGNLAISPGESFIYNTPGDTTMSNGGAETRPRNIALLYCIKV